MKKRIRMFLPILVIVAMLASAFGMATPVMANGVPQATPPGANTNNVQMSLTAIPGAQEVGGNIDFYIVVTNPQHALYPLFQSADAQNMTVTFYPSQADGTPSLIGIVVGNIPYLAVNGAPVVFGPLPYAMPVLNAGVTVATYKAILDGIILIDPSQPFINDKQAGVTLIDWTIDKTVTDVGGDGASGSVDAAGDTISYQVVITNTGGAWLQGSLNESLPGIYGMTGPVESVLTDGYLEPGETWTYTYYYNATQGDINNNGIDKDGLADGDGDIDNEATFTDNHGNSKSDSAEVPIVLNPCIHIEKTTNGGDGLDIPVGDPVTWTYTVTNCGNVALSNITVTDSEAGVTPAYVSGDDGDDILQTTETWIFEATGTATLGTYTNTGYVDGYYGTTLVEDDDASSYFGTDACIHIEKTTNGGDGLNIPVGALVTWTYTVTNCGNVALSNITVTDSEAGVTPAYVSGDDGDDILQTTETWIFEASDTAVAGTYTNTGYVDGYYGTTLVEDDDASGYFGTDACIHIEKTTNGGDGLNIPVGALVTWTYTVTNCGNVALSNITVTDSEAGVTPAYVSGDDGDDILQTTETWIFEASDTAVAGTYTNTGYVDGYYGTTLVEDDDPSGYFGTEPCIDIEKLVSVDGGTTWLDADTATGPIVAVGSNVKFKVIVTNCGNVELTGIVVGDTDFTFTGVASTLAPLASDESDILTVSALEGQQDDLADVTGTPPVGSPVTDSDPAYYFGEAQQCTGCLKICKFEDKNGNGAKNSGESWLSGWTFNVTGPQGYSQVVTTGSGGSCGSCGGCGCDYCKTLCGLAPGVYTITEIPKAGWACTTGNPREVTVECDKTTTVSFGNQKLCTGSLKIYKFEDKNGNGKKDWSERYLSGWVFTVTGPGGYSKVVTTGSSGYVTISGLAPGEYTITETLKTGWTCTTGNPYTVTVVGSTTTTVKFGNKKQGCSPCG